MNYLEKLERIGAKKGINPLAWIQAKGTEIKTVQGNPWSPPPRGAIREILENFGPTQLWRAKRGSFALTPREAIACGKIQERWGVSGYPVCITIVDLGRRLEKKLCPWKRLIFWI